jgi:DNA-binding SARP family transcriptional activator
MEFGVLGPLVVRRGSVVVPVRRGKERVLLAALLLEANRAVTVMAIAETLWGPAMPPSAGVTIRNYVRRLRNALGEDGRARIRAQPRGYMIHVADGELDLVRFEAQLASAQAAARHGSWDRAGAQAGKALALWRGDPLADVDSDTLALREGPRLTEMRLQALETRIDADLHQGGHAEVIAELQRLAAAHPLREHLHGLLMLALYRCSRQSDALAAYQRARKVLADELGADPGTELQELHQQILTADPTLVLPQPELSMVPVPRLPPAAVAASRSGVPRQLPGSAAHFTGRKGELAALSEILDQAGDRPPGTVVIGAIGGMAGVGKTALAVHWAHQVAGRFPDGQLYVNLRGFDRSGTPAASAEAIRGFLDALGVPPDRIPADPDVQAGLFRGLLAGRKILIVLDNARDEQQVRPLLPGSPGCLVIVTSRRQLLGLAAAEGARLLTLGPLSPAEARLMLTARLDTARADNHPGAVTEVADLCARLPLALAIAAARAAARPSLPLGALATELRDAGNRLDVLDTGDPAVGIRAVFSWSSQQLSPPAARLFRLLGLHSGPDITARAAASLAGLDLAGARRLTRELARAHLITEHTPGRYCLHDLLRTYATDQAHAEDSYTDRHSATQPVLESDPG